MKGSVMRLKIIAFSKKLRRKLKRKWEYGRGREVQLRRGLRVQGEILGELFGIFMRVECLMLNKAVAMWKAKLEMPHFEHGRDSHSRVNEGRNFKTLFSIINDNPFL
jgi:hypothetical protein